MRCFSTGGCIEGRELADPWADAGYWGGSIFLGF